jgi:hypothetical protein
MKRSYFFSIAFIVAVATTFAFNNCSDSLVGFDLFSNKESLSSNEQTGGSGEGYLGKPDDGNYDRKFPDFQCQNADSSQAIMTVNSTNAVLEKDICQSVNFPIPFVEPNLSFTVYNTDFIAYRGSIFEKRPATGVNLDNIPEAFCRFTSNTSGVDVVIRAPINGERSGKLWTATPINFMQGFKGSWTGRNATLTRITHQQSDNKLIYSSEESAFLLTINEVNIDKNLYSGQVRYILDGAESYAAVDCRLGNKYPTLYTTTGLTQIQSLNIFTTDAQESICSLSDVLSCDNFEKENTTTDMKSTKFKRSGVWSFGVISNISISSIAEDGNHAMQIKIPQNGWSSGNLDFYMGPQQATETFYRFYVMWSANYVTSTQPSNLLILQNNATSANSPSFFLGFDSAGAVSMRVSGGLPNYSSVGNLMSKTSFQCIEIRVKPGTGDGQTDLWVNNLPMITLTNQNFTFTPDVFMLAPNWGCVGGIDNATGLCSDPTNTANQHPDQYIYIDNIVVANQRIGCF